MATRPPLPACIVVALGLVCAATGLVQTGSISAQRSSAGEFVPRAVRFGATVAETEKALRGLCRTVALRRIDPPFRVLRGIKDKQMQIDCDGLAFAGKPRWAEFVFGDDSLEMVWIMTSKADETALRARMSGIAGAPDRQNAKFVSFAQGRMALRTDVPEVLLYSEKMVPRVSPWFDKDSTF